MIIVGPDQQRILWSLVDDGTWVGAPLSDFVITDDGSMMYWPMCAIPGCEGRICIGRSDRYCFPHSGGIVKRGWLIRIWEAIVRVTELITVTVPENSIPVLRWLIPTAALAFAFGLGLALI